MTGSAPQTSSPAPKAPARTFSVSDGAAARIKLLLDQRNTPQAGLRVAVRGGGCSGLAYVIEWAEGPKERDKIFEKGGVRVFVDAIDARRLPILDLAGDDPEFDRVTLVVGRVDR